MQHDAQSTEAAWNAGRPLGKAESKNSAPWPTLRRLPPLTPAVPSLPEELIPASLKPWLVDVADRSQIPLDFLAAPTVVALGSIVGRSVGIHPKQKDDWTVVANTWGEVIGRPGMLKTPALNEALRPIRRLAANSSEIFKREEVEGQTEIQVLKIQISALQDDLRAAIKKDTDTTALQADLIKLNERLRDADRHERRYITNDTTVEKVGELLNQNPRGLMLVRDELSGWLRSLDKQGREGEREFFLEAWNGSGSFTYDRIGRGTLHIEATILSVLGTIQPGKLRALITSAVQSDSGDDGLLQRFQVTVWPDSPGEWKNVDRWPDGEARERAYNTFAALDQMDANAIGTVEEYDEIPTLRFTLDAQELFDAWRGELETRLRSPEMEPTPAFESHLAKYRSLMPSLALIFHLVEVVNGDAAGKVSLSAARVAAAWCEFLEAHARKVYAPELQGDTTAAHALAEKIRGGMIEDGTTVREIYRPAWSGLTTPDLVMAGLEVLKGCGRVRIEQRETAGHPRNVVRLHPDALRGVA